MVLLFILIGVVVLTWLSIFIFDWDDGFFVLAVPFAAIVILGLVNGIYNDSESVIENAERINIEKTELVALNNSSEYTGTFFLAFGSLDEKDEYKFITKDEDGGMEISSISTHNVIIYEIPDATSAYMETSDLDFPSTWYAFGGENTDKVRFYVPEGSVQKDFNVALD